MSGFSGSPLQVRTVSQREFPVLEPCLRRIRIVNLSQFPLVVIVHFSRSRYFFQKLLPVFGTCSDASGFEWLEVEGKFPVPGGNAKGSVLQSCGLLCSLLRMWDWIMIKDALRAIVEIFILWVFLYQIYRAFHATRGARIMVGLFACFLALVVLTNGAELQNSTFQCDPHRM